MNIRYSLVVDRGGEPVLRLFSRSGDLLKVIKDGDLFDDFEVDVFVFDHLTCVEQPLRLDLLGPDTCCTDAKRDSFIKRLTQEAKNEA